MTKAKETPVDAQLHVLRSCARVAAGKGAVEIESARFQLFLAVSEERKADAQMWLRAVDMAVRTYLADHPAHRQAAIEAVEEIRELTKEMP